MFLLVVTDWRKEKKRKIHNPTAYKPKSTDGRRLWCHQTSERIVLSSHRARSLIGNWRSGSKLEIRIATALTGEQVSKLHCAVKADMGCCACALPIQSVVRSWSHVKAQPRCAVVATRRWCLLKFMTCCGERRRKGQCLVFFRRKVQSSLTNLAGEG